MAALFLFTSCLFLVLSYAWTQYARCKRQYKIIHPHVLSYVREREKRMHRRETNIDRLVFVLQWCQECYSMSIQPFTVKSDEFFVFFWVYLKVLVKKKSINVHLYLDQNFLSLDLVSENSRHGNCSLISFYIHFRFNCFFCLFFQ